jgi:hypothetical protein
VVVDPEQEETRRSVQACGIAGSGARRARRRAPAARVRLRRTRGLERDPLAVLAELRRDGQRPDFQVEIARAQAERLRQPQPRVGAGRGGGRNVSPIAAGSRSSSSTSDGAARSACRSRAVVAVEVADDVPLDGDAVREEAAAGAGRCRRHKRAGAYVVVETSLTVGRCESAPEGAHRRGLPAPVPSARGHSRDLFQVSPFRRLGYTLPEPWPAGV